MAIRVDALRQSIVPRGELDAGLREEHGARDRGAGKHLVLLVSAALGVAVVAAASVSLAIVFPGEWSRRPFCRGRRIQALPVLDSAAAAGDSYHGAFYLTEEEAADYYWMVVFLPSAIVFLVSAIYLFSGIAVACSAPMRHPCLKVVENNFCASKRGGVRCLSIINSVFAVIFSLMAIFLGSSLLTLASSCSFPLFCCYEIVSWGLVVLYGFTAIFLRTEAAVMIDEAGFRGRNLGLEMSESVLEVTPEMERRIHEGFRSWMGSSLLSSDEEDCLND